MGGSDPEKDDGIVGPRPRAPSLPPYVPGPSMDQIIHDHGIEPHGVTRLSSNENPLGPPLAAIEAIKRDAARAHLYPDGNGTRLKKALASIWDVSPDWITLGNGSAEVIESAAAGYLGSGDEAVGFEYGFALFRKAAMASGQGFREIPMADGFQYDPDALAAGCVPPVRVVFLANPNNPTGSFLTGKELESLLDNVPPDILFVLDEAYHGYPPRDIESQPPDGIDILKRLGSRNLLVTRSFSKIYGLAGLRVGAGIAHPSVVEVLERVRSPINVNCLAQTACLAALSSPEHLERSRELTKRGRSFLIETLEKLPVRVFGDSGNFLMLDLGRSAAPVIEKMALKGVIVRGLTPYGLNDCLRVTIGTMADCARFVEALVSALG
ncbi:MAG: histidinol-phosphate transaminase [Deltaproteobacteria bacterium]|nr:histidinol-phosphate transaminase [Deltaproteobacteria bacterium]